ncbi:MAG: hypothetical protein ACOYKN_17800 [Pirellula sp.]
MMADPVMADPVTADPKQERCQSCEIRREKLQAIGVAIFFPSLFTCGLMLPFSVIAAIVVQSLAYMKCKSCRQRAKQARRDKRTSANF